MAYHVEIRRTRRHARLFNLGADELRRTVIDPWRRGGTLELADQRWERRDAELRILEGPELASVDLAHSQGWNNALRTARDVTKEMLAAADTSTVAVLAATEDAAAAGTEALRELSLSAVDWAPVRRQIAAWLSGSSADATLEVLAVLIICTPQSPDWWLLDAGLALGALGQRAVLVKVGVGPLPPALRDLDVLTLDDGPRPDLDELAERLRRAGAAVGER